MTKTMTYKRVVALAIPVLLVTAALVGYLPADNDKEVVKDRAAVAGPSAAESKTNPPAADQTRSATPPGHNRPRNPGGCGELGSQRGAEFPALPLCPGVCSSNSSPVAGAIRHYAWCTHSPG